ncbi:YlmH family RNA-binding protein [Amphibacillus sediminis]|uniref:YlmH family RNA-binding protein n=1 Tax=Amphibacillus sediminis TaxID=360185 RepID=UPI00082ADE9F|nr:YlmH/Sll1252 family protein [Amphibacillus sediminis]
MEVYQHFRKDEQPFIDQIFNWKDYVEQRFVSKFTDFLDPREQLIFQTIIGNNDQLQLAFYGGIDLAERKQAVLAPYYEAINDDHFPISVLKASYPMKFANIEHRDVMGAFLSLGLMRKKLGDIIIDPNKGKIQLCVSADVADFVKLQLTSIKRTKLQFEACHPDQLLAPLDKWITYEGTISSLRLDLLVKHIYRYSRSQAVQLIEKGDVKVNFKVIDNPAFIVETGDVLSCRGKGRSRLLNILGQTKKDNWRIQFQILS